MKSFEWHKRSDLAVWLYTVSSRVEPFSSFVFWFGEVVDPDKTYAP